MLINFSGINAGVLLFKFTSGGRKLLLPYMLEKYVADWHSTATLKVAVFCQSVIELKYG